MTDPSVDDRVDHRAAWAAWQRDRQAPLIEACEIVVAFGGTPVLNGASLAVCPGEIVAVTGSRSSGKSTLLLCLAGIVPPDSGSVVFDGSRLDSMRARERKRLWRRDVGFVFPGWLVPGLTARENVALPLLFDGARRAVAMREARSWFSRLGLSGLEDRYVRELSPGQARSVAVARAMVTRPSVVFADEPAAETGPRVRDRAMDLLIGTALGEGVTVVLATSDSRVASGVDRTVVVRDGLVWAAQ